ncbi:MAG TPA: polysaccharide lyase [Verrucomicrobiae bacterium]|nr:polysaccharide lyase [Verrucomicrobiae bacterium]
MRRAKMTNQALVLLLAFCQSAQVCMGAGSPSGATGEKERHFTARDVFALGKTVIFQDDFLRGTFERWNFSEDDNYGLAEATAGRIRIVDAPGLGGRRKAVRFAVRRAPNSFRSEISLPSEKGFWERWYGERILVPDDWVFDPNRGADIVMQWHAIPGNWKATYPNLAISIQNTNWFIAQSYGSAQSKPTRTRVKLDGAVQTGCWVAWVVHAKWSPGEDGLLQIWKDGKQVLGLKGANVYSTIGVEYTPYLKTGIYHPEWHTDTGDKRAAFDREDAVATNKVIYVTDVKVGGERARYEDVAPGP